MHNHATAARIASNEVRFRTANERIRRAATLRHFDDQRVPFLCECHKLDCTQVVLLDLETYGEIRANPRRFFAMPGHATDAVAAGAEVVIEERDGVIVLEKLGIAGKIAEEAHPG
jgi:hypothetical protein